MKRLIVVLLAFVVVGSGCGKPEPQPPRMVPSCVLKGSWYDIGRQTAYYFPGSIIKGALIFRFFMKVSAEEARVYYDEIESSLPAGIQDHMQGMADGLSDYWHVPRGLARDMVLIWNLGIEVNAKNKTSAVGCTAFAFDSPAGTFLAHNTDNRPGTGGMGSAFYYQPDNGDNHFLSFFAPGFAGVGIGMNTSGLAITYNVGRPNKDAQTGLPGIFMARHIMAKCSTLEEALAMFSGHLERGGHYAHGGLNFLVVDFKDSSMARIQLCSGDIKITRGREIKPGIMFEGCSNHFDDDFAPLEPAERGDPLNISSLERLARLLELAPSFSSYDLQTCWDILTDSEEGAPSNTTICRRCDISETTMTNVFTRDTAYYTLGLPCDYLEHYGAPLQMPVAAPVVSISGQVTIRGKALGKAGLLAQSLTDRDIQATTITAPDGVYTFYNLPEGQYRVTVSKLFHIGTETEVSCSTSAAKEVNFNLVF